mgnify:CR=1 FL=1
MKVLFIAGTGRSGTTLVDILLDTHSQVTALGATPLMPRQFKREDGCACGAPTLSQCPLWSRVDAVLRERHGRSLASLDLEARDFDVFSEDNRIFFEAAAEAGGTPYVTDAYKSPRRLWRLLSVPGIEVVPIHVLRDARGYAYSQRKRKRHLLRTAFTYTYRSILFYAILRRREHLVLEYEQLARDPEGVLSQVMAYLGLALEPAQLRWAEYPHHNKEAKGLLKKTAGSAIRPDTGWRQSMPIRTQRLINAVAWAGNRLNRLKERRWGLARAGAASG